LRELCFAISGAEAPDKLCGFFATAGWRREGVSDYDFTTLEIAMS
jgi:hypothetical protein